MKGEQICIVRAVPVACVMWQVRKCGIVIYIEQGIAWLSGRVIDFVAGWPGSMPA